MSPLDREHPIVDVRSSRVGTAGILSQDVHSGPPGLRSLRLRHPWLRLLHSSLENAGSPSRLSR